MPAETPGQPDDAPPPETPEASEPDAHHGAIEGDRPNDEQHHNAGVPALDDQGLPSDAVKICEDAIGANVDESQG
ncbi:MAG TPA: hypothetical protein VK911_08355 [Vicinamibacterales bacterium]|nr:hypothetical protein [Vicinamibacterales bacterium]